MKTLSVVRLVNGEAVPTLEAVCQVLSGRARIDLEVKDARASQLGLMLAILRRYDLEKSALVTAFDGDHLARFRSLGFSGRTGLLIGSKSFRLGQRVYEAWPLPELRRVGATDLVIHHKLIHPILRTALRLTGTGLWLWCSLEDEQLPANRRALMYQRAARRGASGLIVGRISEARQVLGRGTTLQR